MKEVIVSWSGGKDCTLACYRAIRQGLKVKYLASIITESTGKLWPHLLAPEVLRLQAEAMDIDLLEWKTKISEYADNYRRMLRWLKDDGVNGVVFGDVRLGNSSALKHLEWIKSECEPVGMGYYLPLWDNSREELLLELIDLGFEVRLIAVDSTRLGKDWLGRKLDGDMLRELKLRHSSSPDGSVGYYHTFVTDGPIFKHKLVIEDWEAVFDEQARVDGKGVWYMDIKECHLDSKEEEDILLSEAAAVEPSA